MSPVPGARRREVAEAMYTWGALVVRVAPREINLTALSTLATLDRTGPRRVTELAVVQRVKQPTMTSLVKGLERDGYAERRDDPDDRRAALVAITPAGQEALRARRRTGTEAVDALIDKLDDDEQTALLAALPAVRRLLELDESAREA
jgi:DNA-binding MarR family transcriptional regulator